jgi:hypothetical protein
MGRKDKRSAQSADRARHKDALKDLKNRRRGTPDLERAVSTREERPTILVVCEGVNTEPGYFRKFRLSSADIKAVGEGYNTISLVKRAIKLRSEGQYEQVWCVFDKDDFLADDFNGAIQLAENHGFKVAYSNQAFEYWIVLHFEDHQGGGIHREQYGTKLNGYLHQLGARYDSDGSKEITDDIFDHLMANDPKTGKRRVDLAILRATRIYDQYDHRSPALEESSTTVFRLVEEILRYV